jgi:hypothetical protein
VPLPLSSPQLVFLAALAVFAGGSLANAADPGSGEVLQTYCFDCHDNGTRKGNLSLEKLDFGDPARDAAVWEKVIRKLDHRHMPPVGEARPDDATYRRVIAELVAPLDTTARAHPTPGRTDSLRRLNRTEYQTER